MPFELLLPHAPSLLALVVVAALPVAAAVLLAPPRRRTLPAVLAGIGLLLGSIALVGTPGVRGPIRDDPTVLSAQHLVAAVGGALLIAGTLCLLAAIVLTLLRPRSGRARVVLSAAAAVLIGVGSPSDLRISIGRQLWSMEFHGGVVVPVIAGLLLLAVLSALLVAAGSRAAAVAVGISAAAVPAAVLPATTHGMGLLSSLVGGQPFALPPVLVMGAAVCVGLLGAGVWTMAGDYWDGTERVNSAGDSPDSSSRSS